MSPAFLWVSSKRSESSVWTLTIHSSYSFLSSLPHTTVFIPLIKIQSNLSIVSNWYLSNLFSWRNISFKKKPNRSFNMPTDERVPASHTAYCLLLWMCLFCHAWTHVKLCLTRITVGLLSTLLQCQVRTHRMLDYLIISDSESAWLRSWLLDSLM